MDYHKDRFEDCSLLFFKKEQLLACFPANFCKENHTVFSHQGLTYGGFILHPKATAVQVLDMFGMLKAHFADNYHATHLIYKCIPHIYHRLPSEEDLYALFVHQAQLKSRGISSAIDLQGGIGINRNRRRMLQKAEECGLTCGQTTEESEVRCYWGLLNEVLENRHGIHPVHSAEEMLLLMNRFPDHILQYLCKTPKGELAAGAWVFLCNDTVHVQYGSTSDYGKESGALDLIYNELINRYKETHKYLEFGISTENDGKELNTNLIHQKESFGGRGICYDIYKMAL